MDTQEDNQEYKADGKLYEEHKIRDMEPLFNESGNIIPKQKFCATCRHRLNCYKLQSVINEEVLTCTSVLASMYHICDDFVPIYIEFPIVVNNIVSDSAFDTYNEQTKVGSWCAVKVEGEEDLHIGIMLGVMPLSIISLFDAREGTIRNTFNTQPAILVPYFNKVYYAMNMQWQLIEKGANISSFNEDEPFLDKVKEFVEKN